MNNPTLSNEAEKPIPDIRKIIKDIIISRGDEVDKWFEDISEKTPPFFYNSVDLRNSGFKLAPVDTNLFPAGFNNLNETERKKAEKTTKEFFAKYHPKVKKILIVAEDHTRNVYYLENIAYLTSIIKGAGLQVCTTNLATSESGEDVTLKSASDMDVIFKPAIRDGNRVKTKCGFDPDFILVNNDLTDGAPELLKDVEQIVSPPVGFGWYRRRKTSHFETYNNMARDFSNKFNIDPWLITTYFQRCGVVDFKERKGIECVALRVDKTIDKIKAKYDEYGIKEEPYVFIKSDRGTYGMGIMTASSGDEVFEMSKKIRNKMNTIKGGIQNTEVIIQEGVPTIDEVEGHPAEPMIYMIGAKPAGCIYRLNTQKDSYGNLNAKGMGFASISSHTNDKQVCDSLGLISRIASHAAAWECYEEIYSI
ncbi:MAG: glutamate--cysteine ligase [Alphaproteobacteria bacterium CG11_big_fil_rev_8_21_14_0_20_39_49]|nr:MAG: glutamate--cysteine ligase [Alphaproteobacteria bacterium CG11_big_fil_rev_8_21_14_0_20_39_49]